MTAVFTFTVFTSFRSRDEQEVAGYADLMELIFESWTEIPLTENHLRQLHGVLLRHSDKDERHRGHFKTNPNHVIAFDAEGNLLNLEGAIVQDLSASAVPVPAALWLFGSGLLAMLGVVARKTPTAS